MRTQAPRGGMCCLFSSRRDGVLPNRSVGTKVEDFVFEQKLLTYPGHSGTGSEKFPSTEITETVLGLALVTGSSRDLSRTSRA